MKQNLVFKYKSKLSDFFRRRVFWPFYMKTYADDFERVPVYVMFLGYPRSSHSLIGALLDAHPEMWIAHELNVLKYVQKGESRDKIFARLIGRGKWFKSRNNTWTGYSYKVPSQWQGRYTTLNAIGDKRGGASTRWVRTHPELLDRLKDTIGKPIKIIHIIRNPFDNITTRARGGNMNNKEVTPEILFKNIELHFKDTETINRVKQSGKFEIFELHNEQLLSQPVKHLTQLCRFIGVEPYEDYLRDAAGIVRKSTSKTRLKIQWPEEARKLVMEKMKKYDFLKGYDFET